MTPERREELRGRIASIIENNTSPLVLEPGKLTSSEEIAELIMKEIEKNNGCYVWEENG